jgi:hypothetical protein
MFSLVCLGYVRLGLVYVFVISKIPGNAEYNNYLVSNEWSVQLLASLSSLGPHLPEDTNTFLQLTLCSPSNRSVCSFIPLHSLRSPSGR